jgi:hypothetical protein
MKKHTKKSKGKKSKAVKRTTKRLVEPVDIEKLRRMGAIII